jgi:hypothetical protein
LLRKGFKSCEKLVSSVEDTKENTVQVETVPLNSFQVVPTMLILKKSKVSFFPSFKNCHVVAYVTVPICEPAGLGL